MQLMQGGVFLTSELKEKSYLSLTIKVTEDGSLIQLIKNK